MGPPGISGEIGRPGPPGESGIPGLAGPKVFATMKPILTIPCLHPISSEFPSYQSHNILNRCNQTPL